MLTPKQNFLESVKGGNPDRYSNQYEAIRLTFHPAIIHGGSPMPGQENVVNAWGVTNSWPANVPGAFPVHTPEKIVIKDIEHCPRPFSGLPEGGVGHVPRRVRQRGPQSGLRCAL